MENPKNVTGPEETEVCIGCGIGFLCLLCFISMSEGYNLTVISPE